MITELCRSAPINRAQSTFCKRYKVLYHFKVSIKDIRYMQIRFSKFHSILEDFFTGLSAQCTYFENVSLDFLGEHVRSTERGELLELWSLTDICT